MAGKWVMLGWRKPYPRIPTAKQSPAFNAAGHQMKIKLIAILLAGTSLASMSLPAHHGGSFYDGMKSTTVRGAVTEFRFANPHVVIAIP